LKKSERIDLTCGENFGECFAHAQLLAKTAEAAEQVKTAADGIVAIVKLHAIADNGAGELIDRLTVRVDGRTVKFDFRVPAGDLAAMLEKAMQAPAPVGGK
jgi:hypothetical protein